MSTADLAKELDSLARTLRSFSPEAQAAVVEKLNLKYARSLQELTLGGITAALAAAQKQAGPRARDLRKDVFDRRIETLSEQFASKLAGLARARAGAIGGDVLSFRSTGRPAGAVWYGDVISWGDRTPVASEVYAWHRAARYAVARLIPAYGRQELERAADARAGIVSPMNAGAEWAEKRSYSWRFAERFGCAIDKWVDEHATLRVRLDAGKVAQVWGVDPKPYSGLLDEVAAGNADPIGLFGAPVAVASPS